MTIYRLNKTLEKISEDAVPEQIVDNSPEKTEVDKKHRTSETIVTITSSSDIDADNSLIAKVVQEKMLQEHGLKDSEGYVFICDSQEASQGLQLAGISYEGEINLSSIEFCKVESQQDCLLGTLRIPRLSDICGRSYKIQFFVNKNNLVIVDDTNFSSKIVLRIMTSKTKQGQNREQFLYNFLTDITSRDLDLLKRFEHQIMDLDEAILDGEFGDYKRQAFALRKQLLTLREYYDELCDLGKQLEEDENKFFVKKNLKVFGTVSDRADRLMNRSMHLLDYLMQIRDFYNQKISDKQNKNMEFLTVISTIFFPLTLITGWFGMNFENMPELKNGYPYVCVLSVCIIIGIIVMLKKRDII